MPSGGKATIGRDGESVRRRAVLAGLGAAGLAALAWPRAGGGETWPPRPAGAYGANVAVAWFDHALDRVQATPGFSPPVVARMLGYAGVALYEAVAPGVPGGRSLAGLLSGLTPPPIAGEGGHHWPTVGGTAIAVILEHLCPTAPAAARAATRLLQGREMDGLLSTVPAAVMRRSVERGVAVADHVFAWSATDGGHEGDRRSAASYEPPVGPGSWVPTPPDFRPALQPRWGANRPFLPQSAAACRVGLPVPYSSSPRSDFHAEAWQVYAAVNGLSPEQREVALFWSDDAGRTPTPAGHSVAILTQVLRETGATLDVAAEAYARLGIAVADAFIACWRTKYRLNLLRPVTYIRNEIDPDWTPLLVTPPFPEHTSGHSVQSAATAEVLTQLFGKRAFTDRTHERRGRPPRAFGSFWEAAREAAISRLYGGIHFRSAIVAGLEEGRCIGRLVNALRLRV